MSQIELECECGKRLRVPAEAAGRRGRCPACQRTLVVPEQHLEECRCFCGHVHQFPAEQMGTTIECPECGRSLFLAVEREDVLLFEVEAEPTVYRCAACAARIEDLSIPACPECGGNPRTGHINFRRVLPGSHRSRRPPTGVQSRAPVARPVEEVSPTPAAFPPFDESSVRWKDTPHAQTAEEFVEELGDEGADLDFSPSSLAVLEWLLDSMREKGAVLVPQLEGASAYLGEVVTRNIGGAWGHMGDRVLVGGLPQGLTFDPRAVVKGRLIPGDSPPASLVSAVKDLLARAGLLRT